MKKILILLQVLIISFGCTIPDGTTVKAKKKKSVVRDNTTRDTNDERNDDSENTNRPIPEEKIEFSDISTLILKPYGCINCHGWADNEKGVLRRVEAGFPEESILFNKLENGSMPPRGKVVTTKELDVLRTYIEELKGEKSSHVFGM